MIAGLAVGIAFSYAPVREVKRVVPDRGTVYVDPARLMSMHPSWQALGTMRKTLADMDVVDKNSPSSVGLVQVAQVSVPGSTGSGTVEHEREELRAESMRQVVGALGQLEAERRQALERRLHTMRADMTREEERKLRLQAQEIEAGVSEQLQFVAQKSSFDRINAQLKLSTLKAAGKLKGVDSALINSRTKAAQSELDRVTRIHNAESNEVLAEATASIDDLSAEAQSKINATLDIYERGETRRIEQQVASARDQILQELDSYVGNGSSRGADMFGKRRGDSMAVSRVVGDGSRTDIDDDAAVLKDKIRKLEARIRNEVVRAVKVVADEDGVNVVFTRGRVKLPDKTQDFVESMRKIGWGAYKPVVLGALGS